MTPPMTAEIPPARHLRTISPADVVAPKRERFPRWLVPAAIALFVTIAAFFALNYLATAGQQQDLASTAQQACDAGVVAPSPDGAALCAKAQQVQATPVPGIPGSEGPAGRGITATNIRDGRLVISYSDGTSADLGVIVGQAGAAGQTGRGVTSTELVGSRLVVHYTDGTSEDVGTVVGPPGRGIASASTAGGRLVLTYTDGTTEDVGPLPQGPAGTNGSDGQNAPSVQSVTKTYSDGATESCTRSGGADTDPQFTCTTTPATPTPTDEPPPPPILGG